VADILVVHEQPHLRQPLVDYLRRTGQMVCEAADLQQHLAGGNGGPSDYDVVLLATKNKDMPQSVRHAKTEWPMAEVVIIGDSTDLSDAVDAIRQGACDYVISNDLAKVGEAVRSAVEKRFTRDDHPRVQMEVSDDAIAVDPATCAVFQRADRAAAVNSTVLITGESGTGKEVLARRIHRNSYRRRAKFVPVNCGSIPETLIETELFGYRKGAFTGAVTNTRGLIEEAEGGVLFLDEIGDMPLSMQVRLLRFLDSGEVRAVGGCSVRHLNVRVIAATNRSLEAEIQQKRFREDLFFRLSVIQLHLPPLRERRADLPALIHYHARRAATRLGMPTPKIAREAMAILVQYHWPGNIRQLQNALEQSLVQAAQGVITPHELPAAVLRGKGFAATAVFESELPTEQDRLETTLRRHNGNHTEAAAELGISRTTLWRRLRQQKSLEATVAES
jgi:DNA-binding NtrC family response regulator